MGSSLVRVATWGVAFVIGAVFGVAGTIGQAAVWELPFAALPVGIVVAVVGAAALLLAVRALTADRWAALATGMGIMLVTLVFSGRGPGGSIVVPAPAADEVSTGVIWTLAVPILVALVVAWPTASRARTTN